MKSVCDIPTYLIINPSDYPGIIKSKSAIPKLIPWVGEPVRGASNGIVIVSERSPVF